MRLKSPLQNSIQFGRIPKTSIKIHNRIVFDFDTFFFQGFLHRRRWRKMMPTRKFPFPIDNPMRRNFIAFYAIVQCPADHSGRPQMQIIGNCAIIGHSSFWNHASHIENKFVIMRFGHWCLWATGFKQ